MNEEQILQLIKVNIYVLIGLISFTLILFFLLIKYKEYLKKTYIRKYKFYEKAFYKGIDENFCFPKKDAQILLDVILTYSENNNVDCSDIIIKLELDKLLIHNLKYKNNKILAFKNIATSQIQDMYNLLKKYWYSNDFEESYFSLYYTIYLSKYDKNYIEILEAIFKAEFSNDRKVEMIRFMGLDNQTIIKLCEEYKPYKNILLGSIDSSTLTIEEYNLIKQIGKENYFFVIKELILYGAYDILWELIKCDDLNIKRKIAFELKNNICNKSFELLKFLIKDSDFSVRYNAVIGILLYDDGIRYLREIENLSGSEDVYNMAQLHLAMQKEGQ